MSVLNQDDINHMNAVTLRKLDALGYTGKGRPLMFPSIA